MQLFHFFMLFTFITGLNTSEEEDPHPSLVPHTVSVRDLDSSPRGSGSPRVTPLLHVFGFGNAASVRQGGGFAGSGDNTRFRVVSQEVTHNGQEKAGNMISDLVHTPTHSLTDSGLSFTQRQHDASLFKAHRVSDRTLSEATSADLNTGPNLFTDKVPHVTTDYSDVHNDTDAPSVSADLLHTLKIPHLGDITVRPSVHKTTQSYLTILGNRATITELETPESPRLYQGTDGRNVAVTSSTITINAKTHHSSETFRTNHLPGLSVTDGFLRDSVPHLQESNSVSYISDGAVMSSSSTDTAGTRASRTNRLPRSTHITVNVSNGTHSPLVDDASTMTHTSVVSLSYHLADTQTPSGAWEAEDTTNRAVRYSSASYYTRFPNIPTESASTQASHTKSATDPEQSPQRLLSDVNTHMSTMWTDLQRRSATTTTQDFITTSASTLGRGDPTISSTRHTIFLTPLVTAYRNDAGTTPAGPVSAPFTTTATNSIPVSEEQTHNANAYKVTETFTRTPASYHHATKLSTDPKSILTTVTHYVTSSGNGSVTPAVTPLSSPISPPTHTLDTVTSSTPPTNQMSGLQTTTRLVETQTPDYLTTIRNLQIATSHRVHTPTRIETRTRSTPTISLTSSRWALTTKSGKDTLHKGRVFIVEDQPVVIKVETFQVLLQVVLEENSAPNTRLVELEPFLRKVAGYQSQHVTWYSGAVLQSMLTFRTAVTVSWLERAESLLQEAGLNPLPTQGVFVSGIRLKNITVGGLHSDVCSWLFSCPPGFSCFSSDGNFSCRSVCHSDYCRNHGICVHRSGHNPLCQCPVGEDFWFMGQRCDLRMTRQKLAGVCFGVLATIAALMGLLSYLTVQRFKKMLIQAKAEQTQSSYRRFNHFDELSARFWRRSWPGSRDSLDNTAFSHSDELLHMRALDRPCCYHDDTLSIASTYPDSVTHLNTVYLNSSQYHWDMSMCSLADGVVDSGKASDLSVCSWPIEPIQWTPFPLLQQLRNTNTMKASRPRSYCEGMELVGLEKSRTA